MCTFLLNVKYIKKQTNTNSGPNTEYTRTCLCETVNNNNEQINTVKIKTKDSDWALANFLNENWLISRNSFVLHYYLLFTNKYNLNKYGKHLS